MKIWKLLYNREEPWAKDFYARTTPFPLSVDAVENLMSNTSIIVGTKIDLDTVYNNYGSSDKFGYNTELGNGTTIPNYYTNPPVPLGENDPGNTFCTPARINYLANRLGIKLSAESGDTLILRRHKTLWISGLASTPPAGDTLIFKVGSTLILEPSAEIEQCFGGQIIYQNGTNIAFSEHTCMHAFTGSGIEFTGNGESVINNGGFVQIDGNANLILGDNTTLTFDGPGDPLILNPGSQVIVGNNAKIQFKNGAHLRANGCTFSCSNGTWQGITLTGSLYDTVQNCTFNNASTYIDMTLDATTARYRKNITGNTFNSGGIKIANVFLANVTGNTFNSAGTSNNLLEITNSTLLRPRSWELNIMNNTFKGGTYQLKLSGYAGNVSSFYIYNNTFTGINSNTRLGLWGNNINGSFKNNTFTDANFSVGFDLLNSSMDLYNNTINSTSHPDIWLGSNSIANLAPIVNGNNQLVWTGGLNKLASNNNIIYYPQGSNAYLNLGNNCLTLTNNAYSHILGYYPGPCFNPYLYITKNKWNFEAPNITLYCDTNTLYALYTPSISQCPSNPAWELDGASPQITSIGGSGIYDTVSVTSNYGSGIGGGTSSEVKIRKKEVTIAPDALLYWNILEKRRTDDYSGSIADCKSIINMYDTSKFLIQSLNELYINYQSIDTNGNSIDVFNELKTYLDNAIPEHVNNIVFTGKAYNYYLKCLTKMGHYSESIAGYENIMTNHPDPVVRLTASWERAAVLLLMNGGGGSESSNQSRNNEKLLKKLLDKNPVHKVAEDKFKLDKKNQDTKTNINFNNEDNSKIERRIEKFNPLSHKELQTKIENDMSVLLEVTGKKSNIAIPTSFSIQQNYPNPFNPTTSIKYALPKDAFVTIKIYDITGREVKTLVNEYGKAGFYQTTFDGTNLASGVYFYRIQAADYVDSKKMVLIK